VSIEEKPTPRSGYAVTGRISTRPRYSTSAASIKPSARGELEFTTSPAVPAGQCATVEVMGRRHRLARPGTHESLLEPRISSRPIGEAGRASKVACPERFAYRLGWIEGGSGRASGGAAGKERYGRYLSIGC